MKIKYALIWVLFLLMGCNSGSYPNNEDRKAVRRYLSQQNIQKINLVSTGMFFVFEGKIYFRGEISFQLPDDFHKYYNPAPETAHNRLQGPQNGK